MGGLRLAEAPTPHRGGKERSPTVGPEAYGTDAQTRPGTSFLRIAPVYPRQCMSPLWTIKTRRSRLSQKGIDAKVARGSGAADGFLRAERDGVALNVPAPAREQIQIELMRIDVFVDVIDWFLADIRSRGVGRLNVALFYEAECDVWEEQVADR